MAWIEVHQALLTHRKTLMVADLLDLPEVYVVGHLVALWSWALDNARDGNLPTSRRFIAKAAQWTGDPDSFVNALCSAGFLDGCADDVLSIHDFHAYVGRLIDKREANAERMRAARANRTAQSNQERAAHVHNTFDACAGATNQPTNQPTLPTNTTRARVLSADQTEAIDYRSQEGVVRLQVLQKGERENPPVTLEEIDLTFEELRARGDGDKCRVTGYVESVLYGNRKKHERAVNSTHRSGYLPSFKSEFTPSMLAYGEKHGLTLEQLSQVDMAPLIKSGEVKIR